MLHPQLAYSLRDTLLKRLAAAGEWVGPADLRAGLNFSEDVLDDVLSQLVIHGDILFNARTLHYRLAVGPAARRAVQRLMRDDTQHKAVIGTPARDGGGYVLGLAKRVGDDVVCAEVAFDYPGADGVAALAPRVAAWLEAPDAP